ncbi:FtsH protease activity modulator HflK [Sphingomonas sp. ASV193]|uniref:FtsH protease activity modulator HflK n=1 Tax=Sphingomonas sp. ASV193 TaxID=3144405 RepID=UPI0032E8BC31
MTLFQRAGRILFADSKGPWGSGSGSGDPPKPEKPASPWAGPQPGQPGGNAFDEWLKARTRGVGGGGGGGGGFGGFRGRPDRSLIGWGLVAFATLWLLLSTTHSIGASDEGVVMQLGRYNRTLPPGVSLTLPWPIESVRKVNVSQTRTTELGSSGSQDLMLTGDQSLIDIAFLVRWNIKNPEQYLFELSDPQETIKQVAESAMRAVVANATLKGAMGPQRPDIEARVRDEMQRTLDSYKSGIQVLGVSLSQADPPDQVNDAFKAVTAAQQEAQSYKNGATGYANQVLQKAQGEATAFDKVYEQYKAAPGVTKRRMYYETMEQVLRKNDKTIIEAPGVNSYQPLPPIRRTVEGGGQ